MAKSVRLTKAMEADLERASQALGISQSQLVREAVARRCDEVLGATLAQRLAPVVGSIKSAGGRARRTGDAFRRALRRRSIT